MQLAGTEWTTRDGACHRHLLLPETLLGTEVILFIPVGSQQTLGLACWFASFFLESKVSRLCNTAFPLQSSRDFQPVEPGVCKTSMSTVPVLQKKHCACRPSGFRSEKVQWDYVILNLIMRGKGTREADRDLVKRVVLLLSPYDHEHFSPSETAWEILRSNPPKLLGTFRWLIDVFHNRMALSLLSLYESHEGPCPSVSSLRNRSQMKQCVMSTLKWHSFILPKTAVIRKQPTGITDLFSPSQLQLEPGSLQVLLASNALGELPNRFAAANPCSRSQKCPGYFLAA